MTHATHLHCATPVLPEETRMCDKSVVLSRNKQNAKVLAHWGYQCFLGSLRKDGSTVRGLHIRLLVRIWSKGTCNSVSITSPLPVITGPLRKRHSLILPRFTRQDCRRPQASINSDVIAPSCRGCSSLQHVHTVVRSSSCRPALTSRHLPHAHMMGSRPLSSSGS